MQLLFILCSSKYNVHYIANFHHLNRALRSLDLSVVKESISKLCSQAKFNRSVFAAKTSILLLLATWNTIDFSQSTAWNHTIDLWATQRDIIFFVIKLCMEYVQKDAQYPKNSKMNNNKIRHQTTHQDYHIYHPPKQPLWHHSLSNPWFLELKLATYI